MSFERQQWRSSTSAPESMTADTQFDIDQTRELVHQPFSSKVAERLQAAETALETEPDSKEIQALVASFRQLHEAVQMNALERDTIVRAQSDAKYQRVFSDLSRAMSEVETALSGITKERAADPLRAIRNRMSALRTTAEQLPEGATAEKSSDRSTIMSMIESLEKSVQQIDSTDIASLDAERVVRLDQTYTSIIRMIDEYTQQPVESPTVKLAVRSVENEVPPVVLAEPESVTVITETVVPEAPTEALPQVEQSIRERVLQWWSQLSDRAQASLKVATFAALTAVAFPSAADNQSSEQTGYTPFTGATMWETADTGVDVPQSTEYANELVDPLKVDDVSPDVAISAAYQSIASIPMTVVSEQVAEPVVSNIESPATVAPAIDSVAPEMTPPTVEEVVPGVSFTPEQKTTIEFPDKPVFSTLADNVPTTERSSATSEMVSDTNTSATEAPAVDLAVESRESLPITHTVVLGDTVEDILEARFNALTSHLSESNRTALWNEVAEDLYKNQDYFASLLQLQSGAIDTIFVGDTVQFSHFDTEIQNKIAAIKEIINTDVVAEPETEKQPSELIISSKSPSATFDAEMPDTFDTDDSAETSKNNEVAEPVNQLDVTETWANLTIPEQEEFLTWLGTDVIKGVNKGYFGSLLQDKARNVVPWQNLTVGEVNTIALLENEAEIKEECSARGISFEDFNRVNSILINARNGNKLPTILESEDLVVPTLYSATLP